MLLEPKKLLSCDLKRSSKLALGRVRVFRGYDPARARRLQKMNWSVNILQRIWRGYLGR